MLNKTQCALYVWLCNEQTFTLRPSTINLKSNSRNVIVFFMINQHIELKIQTILTQTINDKLWSNIGE